MSTPAERYRLAWMSARQRAAAYADEIDDSREERDALRLAVKCFTDEMGGIRETGAALRRAADLANDVMARLKSERDEARAAVVRLGKLLEARDA